MLSRKEKESILKDITELIGKSRFLIFTDPTALDAKKNIELRRALRKIGVEYRLIKKTLFKKAMEEAKISGNLSEDVFKGSMAVLFMNEPNIEAAKILYTFARSNEKFVLTGGWLENQGLSKSQIIEFAKLPPKEVLLGQLASVLQAPLRNMVRVLQANHQQLLGALNAIQRIKA